MSIPTSFIAFAAFAFNPCASIPALYTFHSSDIIDPDILKSADLVVTLCGDATDKCPMTPAHVKREHWGFDAPAKAQGTEASVPCAFAGASNPQCSRFT